MTWMSVKAAAAVLVFALSAADADMTLPELRIEPTDGGSMFYVRNPSSQPLTAYLIELVDYPGSSYSFWEDDTGGEPIPAGGEKRINVTNMTVGAVPEYVKMRAAVCADGSTSGLPDKVSQLIERRRFTLETTRELIRRIDKAQAAATTKPNLIADLKQWSDSVQPAGKVDRTSQAAINQAAARRLISATATRLETQSLDDAMNVLRASERAFVASKPPL